jgi:hypothetical protein
MTGNFPKFTMICDLHTALKIPHVYEFIIKSCRQQMKVMQNFKNENITLDKIKPMTRNVRG